MNNTGETSKIISGMQRTNSRMICNMIYYSIKLKKKMGLPRWRSVKVLNWQCRRCKRREFYPLQLGRSPWRRKWQPTPVFLPGKFFRQRSLVGYSPGSHEDWRSLARMLCVEQLLSTRLFLFSHSPPISCKTRMFFTLCAFQDWHVVIRV